MRSPGLVELSTIKRGSTCTYLSGVVLAPLLIVFTRGRLSYRHYQQEAEALDLPPSMEEKPAPPDIAV